MSRIFPMIQRSSTQATRSKSCQEFDFTRSRSVASTSSQSYASPTSSRRSNPCSNPGSVPRPRTRSEPTYSNKFELDKKWTPELYPAPFSLPNSAPSSYYDDELRNWFASNFVAHTPAKGSPRISPRSSPKFGKDNYDVLRARAMKEKKAAGYHFDASNRSHSKGFYRLAKEQEQEAIEHWKNAIMLKYQAFVQAYATANQYSPNRTIDLHHLLVIEAEWIVILATKLTKELGLQSLTFAVGQGHHSQDGEVKIKPAVVDLLEKEGIRYVIPSNNEGVIIANFTPDQTHREKVEAEDDGWTIATRKSPPPLSLRTLADLIG